MRPTRTTPLRERMRQDLQLAGLSERTQEAYLRAVRQLAEHFATAPDRLSETQLREYFLFLVNETKLSAASIKMAFYGIRFFSRHTEPREWPTLERLKVRPERRLPDVLSRDEVHRIMDAVHTHRNLNFLWSVYSLGLRLDEARHLQPGDIDGKRRLVHVHRGKGARDRYVPCPPGRTPSCATGTARTAILPGSSRRAATGIWTDQPPRPPSAEAPSRTCCAASSASSASASVSPSTPFVTATPRTCSRPASTCA